MLEGDSISFSLPSVSSCSECSGQLADEQSSNHSPEHRLQTSQSASEPNHNPKHLHINQSAPVSASVVYSYVIIPLALASGSNGFCSLLHLTLVESNFAWLFCVFASCLIILLTSCQTRALLRQVSVPSRTAHLLYYTPFCTQ